MNGAALHRIKTMGTHGDTHITHFQTITPIIKTHRHKHTEAINTDNPCKVIQQAFTWGKNVFKNLPLQPLISGLVQYLLTNHVMQLVKSEQNLPNQLLGNCIRLRHWQAPRSRSHICLRTELTNRICARAQTYTQARAHTYILTHTSPLY